MYTTLLATIMDSEDLQEIETESRAAGASRSQRAGIYGDADSSGVRTRESQIYIERIKVKLANKIMTRLGKPNSFFPPQRNCRHILNR